MARITKTLLFFFLLCSAANANLRVISLYPAHTENIIALDGASSLIAVSESDNPKLLPELPRISPRAGAEALLTLSPDIVITRTLAHNLNPSTYDTLSRVGVKVLTIDPPEWADFPQYLTALAGALGLNAEHAVQKFAALTQSISERVPADRPRPRVFLEATSRELRTCAPDSWAANLIALAGGVNIAQNVQPLRPGSALASWGTERLLQAADSIDVYIIQTGIMNAATLKDFHARAWSKALTHAKAAEVPEKFISRPSLLGLERGANMLLKIFWGD